jgi:cell division protein ZapE
VDVLYDHKVRLVLSAEKNLDELLQRPSALEGVFARTQSRLMEMQSEDYLMAPHHTQKKT